MKFKSIEALNNYIKENDVIFEHMDVSFDSNNENKLDEFLSLNEAKDETFEVKLFNSIFDAKQTNDGKNYIVVESCETLENACSSGRITFNNKEYLLNICNENDVTKVNLPINLNDGKIKYVEFNVKLNENKNDKRIQLSEQVMNEIKKQI